MESILKFIEDYVSNGLGGKVPPPLLSDKGVTCVGTYVFRHLISGKIYVGSSKNIRKRKFTHEGHLRRRIHHCKAFQAAHDESPDFEFLLIMTDSIVEALALEQELLNKYWDTGLLLNTSPSAYTTTLGAEFSDERREKMRNLRLGTTLSEETKQRISKASKETMASPEMRELLRQKSISQFNTQEARDRVSELNRGRKHSSESIANMVKGRQHLFKPVSIHGVTYPDIRTASRELGIPHSTISSRLKSSSFKDYVCCDKTQEE